MDKMKIYNALPIWGQNLACTVQGMNVNRKRYSPHFEKSLGRYKKSGNFIIIECC